MQRVFMQFRQALADDDQLAMSHMLRDGLLLPAWVEPTQAESLSDSVTLQEWSLPTCDQPPRQLLLPMLSKLPCHLQLCCNAVEAPRPCQG